MIACTSPGKMGDTLYSLPTIKKLAEMHGTKVDFYTSSYCEPLRNLVEYQPYINSFQLSPGYKILRWDMGCQPWLMPVPDGYEKVYHLGFKTHPYTSLHKFIALQTGVEVSEIKYEYKDFETLDEPYITLAPHGVKYLDVYKEFVRKCPLPVVILGSKNEYPNFGIDMTGMDFLDEATWIAKSVCFIGVSIHLVIAEGFPIPKIVPSAGFDLNHLVYDQYHTFKLGLTPDFLIRMVNNMATFSKTLDPADYELLGGYAKHYDNLLDHFRHVKCEFRFEHQHRKWEYAMMYKVLDEAKAVTVLDVGGGGSIFAPAMEWVGKKVHQVDPGDVSAWIQSQRNATSKQLEFTQEDFMSYQSDRKYDAVTCISVIEHVGNDEEFFKKLLKFVKPGGILAMTTDFHESGVAQLTGHLRTYNDVSLRRLIAIAEQEGFTPMGGVDFSNSGYYVNGCNFVTLVLSNTGKKKSQQSSKKNFLKR